MHALRAAVALALLVLLYAQGTASAQDTAAAVLPFSGAQAGKVRQNVQNGLRDKGVALVPLKTSSSVARKVKGYAKQASKLGASVLVKARVRRVEGRWVATTEVRNAKGQRVEKLEASASSLSRLSSRVVSQLMKTDRMPMREAAPVAQPAQPKAPKQPRLVVRPFSGAQAAKIRGATIRSLRDEPVELYPNAKFEERAATLGANLRADGGHVAPASALGVSGLFEGDVVREDGLWSAYVRLVDGRSANVVRQRYYDSSTLDGLTKVIANRVGPDFRKDIARLGVVAPATVAVTPSVAAPPVRKDPKKDQAAITIQAKSSKGKARRPAAVDIEADFRIVRRTLRYNDDVRGELRDYTLGAAPGVALKFQWYPGAHFTSGVGAQFGIDFEWERLFALDSTRTDGDVTQTFPTESQQFLIGVRWRYPIRIWEPFVVLDYGTHNFRFGVSGPPVPGEDNTAGVPGVTYEFVRFGTGFRVALGKKENFTLGAQIAFRGVFSVGGIGTNTWFPEATANGMDTGLVAGFVLPLGFEVRVGIDYRRYWFDLNPVPPEPPYLAGGALDQYLGGTIGIAWRR